MYRIGWDMPTNGIVYNLLKKHMLTAKENVTDFSAGKILLHKITALNISASTIRTLIQSGYSAQFLLPAKVWQYIQQHTLYGYSSNHFRSQIEGGFII
jgi:nicotinate-nucleotide adenylyltransferase